MWVHTRRSASSSASSRAVSRRPSARTHQGSRCAATRGRRVLRTMECDMEVKTLLGDYAIFPRTRVRPVPMLRFTRGAVEFDGHCSKSRYDFSFEGAVAEDGPESRCQYCCGRRFVVHDSSFVLFYKTDGDVLFKNI